jgi:hypothetical protein
MFLDFVKHWLLIDKCFVFVPIDVIIASEWQQIQTLRLLAKRIISQDNAYRDTRPPFFKIIFERLVLVYTANRRKLHESVKIYMIVKDNS